MSKPRPRLLKQPGQQATEASVLSWGHLGSCNDVAWTVMAVNESQEMCLPNAERAEFMVSASQKSPFSIRSLPQLECRLVLLDTKFALAWNDGAIKFGNIQPICTTADSPHLQRGGFKPHAHLQTCTGHSSCQQLWMPP